MSKSNQHVGKQRIIGKAENSEKKRKISLNINLKNKVDNELKKIYESLRVRSDRQSLYSINNFNKKGIVKLTIANIDLPKINLENRDKRIKTMSSNRNKSETNQRRKQEKQEDNNLKKCIQTLDCEEEKNQRDVENDQQFVLQPSIKRRKSVNLRQHSAYKTLFQREKEKVVIFSSSRINQLIETGNKKKVSLKLNQKQKKGADGNEQLKIKRKTREVQMKFQIQEQIKRQALDCIQKEIKIVDIEKFIQMDWKILSMYPKIDLQTLLIKIKKEQHYRKLENIQKWQHFNRFNIDFHDDFLQNIN